MRQIRTRIQAFVLWANVTGLGVYPAPLWLDARIREIRGQK